MDEAVFLFGNWVEAELEAAAAKPKGEKNKAAARQRRMQAILAGGDEERPGDEAPAPRGAFRDPAALIGAGRRG